MISQMVKMKKGEPLVIKPEHDTQYVLLFNHDAEDTPYSVTLVFAKEGVSAEILAIYKLAKNEKLNLTTVAQHAAPNTTCTTSIKGVLLDGGHSDYVGKILIEKKAQQTNSYLDHNVLVVG